MLGDEGRALLYSPIINYPNSNLDVARELLVHPYAVPGLGDGGAHVGTICDASFPTTLLVHWCRDRARGERLDIPFVIKAQCRETAHTVGLYDRGVLRPATRPTSTSSTSTVCSCTRPASPSTCRRAASGCCRTWTGYRHTFVAGEEVYADSEPTGALPGRLVRGAQPAPA